MEKDFSGSPITRELQAANRSKGVALGALATLDIYAPIAAFVPGGLTGTPVALGSILAFAVATESRTKHLHNAFNQKKKRDGRHYLGRTASAFVLSKVVANSFLPLSIAASAWETGSFIQSLPKEPLLSLETGLALCGIFLTLSGGPFLRAVTLMAEGQIYKTALRDELDSVPNLSDRAKRRWTSRNSK